MGPEALGFGSSYFILCTVEKSQYSIDMSTGAVGRHSDGWGGQVVFVLAYLAKGYSKIIRLRWVIFSSFASLPYLFHWVKCI